MFWLALAALTALAVVLLVVPLLRAGPGASARAEHGLGVSRDQLREIEGDLERGALRPEEADEARLEVQRRMLAADGERGAERELSVRWRGASAVLLALAVPGAAIAFYLWLGSPQTPSQPFASRPVQGAATAQAVDTPRLETLIARLAARLEQAPGDLQGWVLLGRSHMEVGQFGDAADAYRQATTLERDDPGLLLALAESLTYAAEGVVTPEAVRALRRVLALEPSHPGARFYLGLAEMQAGRTRDAFDIWLALAADSPEDAPWLPALRERLEAVAAELGVDLASALPAPRPRAAVPRPGREDIEAAGEMSAEERAAMIRGMVARLAARLEEEPDDLEGWMRLGQAYGVLGQVAAARDAFARAAGLAPDDNRVQLSYGAMIVEAAAPDAPLPETARAVFEGVLRRDPANLDARWFLGLLETRAGRPAEAAKLWRSLLGVLDPDDPRRVILERRLDGLTEDGAQAR